MKENNKFDIAFISRKSGWNYFVFSYRDFLNQQYFLELLMNLLLLNRTYSLLFKLGFRDNIFYMANNQIGVLVRSNHNLRYYRNIYQELEEKIEYIKSKYETKGSPITITLIYKNIIPLPEFSLNETKNISVNNKIIKKSEFNINIISKYLPLTINSSYFGSLLESFLRKKYVSKLIKTISFSGGKENKFLKEVILNINCFDYQIFLKNIKRGITYLIISKKILDDHYIRKVFNLSTGNCIYDVIDIIKDYKNNYFIRKLKNISLVVKNNKLVELRKDITFDVLKSQDLKYIYKSRSNPHFGVLDIETYVDIDGESKVYALGFVTLLEKSNINIFYLSDIPQLDSNLLVILCIDYMLISKYHNYNFYVHNLGVFDVVFLHKILKEYNLHYKTDKYILKSVFRDGVMLKLSVSIKVSNKKYIKINFVDSINLLNDNLDELAKSFKVNTLKGIFPYKFVNKDNLNLNYIGLIPEYKYYKKISEQDYKEIFIEYLEGCKVWNLREEAILYLEKDLISLLEVLDKFNKSLFVNHGIQMTECLSISRIALTKFLNFYLKDSKLPLINKLQHFNFINFGYYGGITEVYIPYGTDLFYYDVNSLYPFVALNPMPGINCTYIEIKENIDIDLNNLFGFFYAKVKTNSNLYLGLLPIKTNLGLILPNGEFEGVWSSEELKFAKENGYEIEIKQGYNFNKVEGVFTEYVNELYQLKSSTEGAEKAVNKSLLNNLLGRFGMNIIKPITKTVNKEELDFILSTREVKSFHEITKKDFLVTYLPLVDAKICSEHGLDYTKVLSKENNHSIEKNIDIFQDVSIAISAMITSYARIFMSKIKLDILNSGGKIYYSDTDSLVTNIDLNIINSNLVGKFLGQFKLEYLIKEGYFISNKTYCLVLHNDKTIIKTKGVLNDSITLEDFKTMYFKTKNVSGIKTYTTKDYTKGYVLIDEKEVTLSHDAYKKREKVFNKDNLWINTKPLIYNYVVISIIPLYIKNN